MRYYLKLCWVLWMYTCTVVMTLCVLVLLFSNVRDAVFKREDTRPAQCLEQGGTWDDGDEICKTAV